VTLSARLAADLATLTEALDEPDSDIEQTLRVLAADAAAVTTTFAGLTAAVNTAGRWTTITTGYDGAMPADVVTSVRIPLTERAYLILYATRRGAFVDMAADLSWLTGRPPDDFVLDADVGELAATIAADDLRHGRAIDQAIGFLIGRGHTPEEAAAELERIASNDGGSRVAAAHVVLSSLDRGADGGLPE
jgi:hypothetical protein